MSLDHDTFFMKMALKQAMLAFDNGEVPIGAVIVHDNEVIASDYNRVEKLVDPTAHAEILVLRRASESISNWRLRGMSLYVTLEPCPMCMGAILLARISRLVWASFDPRMGGNGLSVGLARDCSWATLPDMRGGVLRNESLQLIQTFFSLQRNKKDNSSP
ncbi:nucleoside deaminase [Candidatus Similichlamydia epinepheli]|uniref:nucleoside deaminase n=1 Tax=Candidatus Similichlamydia epinepheli TaxID=1903953 RepID=UPI00195B4F2E|nr:nucleoside deaminase [Candidatus Similichlamydia epinepheli]